MYALNWRYREEIIQIFNLFSISDTTSSSLRPVICLNQLILVETFFKATNSKKRKMIIIMYKFSLSSQGKKFEDSDQLPVCLGFIISKLLWISWRCMRFFQSLISCATLFDEHRILLIINKLWIKLIQRVDMWTHKRFFGPTIYFFQ